MIHEIGVELQAELVAKGCPFTVVDGPERTKTVTFARERVVIEHDESAGDTFGPKHGASGGNPHLFFTRRIAVKLTIYAQASAVGAMPFEHRRRAEHVLDLVVIGLEKVARKRRNLWVATGGKFVQPDDLVNSESIGGAVYEMTFTFDRGIADRTWAGDALPQKAVGTSSGDIKVVSTTKVSATNGPDDDNDPTNVPADAETACGT